MGMLARIPAKAAPELELKFQLSPGAFEALAEIFAPEPAARTVLHAVYFDTPTHALRDGGFSLRVRSDGERHVQTLKHRGDGGLFQRDEWEVEVQGPGLDKVALVGTPAEAAIGDADVTVAFTVEVERRTHQWTQGDTRIEVSIDTGQITAEGRHEPVAELELELISGAPEALFELARDLLAKAPIALAFESKAERGYRLAGHDGVAAMKARRASISPTTRAGDAFQAIAREALVQLANNARLLHRSQNPEVLHQTRVGLRRMRAALAVFAAMLDAEGLNWARTETRWLAGEFSAARDIDVFLQRAGASDEMEADTARAAFYRAVRIAHAEAYERALAALRSDRFRRMLLELGAWIEVGAWRQVDRGEQGALREGPATVLAAHLMDRLDRRLRRGSRKFGSLGVDARHTLRKKAKSLRYAAAFFGDAFPEHPRRRARFVAVLRDLQDQFGALNDMAVARTVAVQAAGRRSSDLAFAAGLEVARLTQDEAKTLKAAKRDLKAYRKGKAFWTAPDGASQALNHSKAILRRA